MVPLRGAVMSPFLEARGLSVRRGGAALVSRFEWRHAPGCIAWLVGPNGAGKSSLMRVLAGLAEAAEGSVERAGGEAIGYYSPGMMLPPAARATAFQALMHRRHGHVGPLGVERPVGSKRMGALSTGEQKRLLLGGILAMPRSFVFLDEPYEHLSADARAGLTSYLVGASQSAVVVVATNQDLPVEADGVRLQLGGGRIEVTA